jgi:hypothetical protein
MILVLDLIFFDLSEDFKTHYPNYLLYGSLSRLEPVRLLTLPGLLVQVPKPTNAILDGEKPFVVPGRVICVEKHWSIIIISVFHSLFFRLSPWYKYKYDSTRSTWWTCCRAPAAPLRPVLALSRLIHCS